MGGREDMSVPDGTALIVAPKGAIVEQTRHSGSGAGTVAGGRRGRGRSPPRTCSVPSSGPRPTTASPCSRWTSPTGLSYVSTAHVEVAGRRHPRVSGRRQEGDRLQRKLHAETAICWRASPTRSTCIPSGRSCCRGTGCTGTTTPGCSTSSRSTCTSSSVGTYKAAVRAVHAAGHVARGARGQPGAGHRPLGAATVNRDRREPEHGARGGTALRRRVRHAPRGRRAGTRPARRSSTASWTNC